MKNHPPQFKRDVLVASGISILDNQSRGRTPSGRKRGTESLVRMDKCRR